MIVLCHVSNKMKSIRDLLKKCFLIIICILMIISQVLTVYAGAASGGGGGGGSVSRSASGGGGGGGPSISSGASGGGGGGPSISSGASGGGGSGPSISSGASGGGGGSDYSLPVGRSASGGGGGNSSNDPTFYDPNAWESINDYYDYLENIGVSIPNDINTVGGVALESRVNSGPGLSIRNFVSENKNNSVDLTSLAGYLPVTAASVYQNDDYNISGVMVTNGVDTKFVITSKDGNATSELLTDWAILTTSAGDQAWYRFDDKGNMTTGFMQGNDGHIYYFVESGYNKGMLATGAVNINGKTYNFSHGKDGLPYGALITP